MTRYISEAIDRLALIDLHRKKSNKSQFFNSNNKPLQASQIQDLFSCPDVPDLQFKNTVSKIGWDIGNYSFKSEIQDNDICNNFATGEYHLNKSTEAQTSVILVHGWRMKNQDILKAIYHKLFQEKGYNIYYFNLPYHLDRTPEKSLYSGELFLSANVDRTILTVRQTVKDIRALIKWIKKDGESHKVILAGISLGGYITNMTAVVEENIDFLISTFYANCFTYTIWNTIPGKHIKKDLVDNGFTYERLKESWDIIDPSIYKPNLSKDKILLYSGRYD